MENPPDNNRTEADKPPQPSKPSDGYWGCLAGLLGFGLVVFFLVTVFIAPRVDPNQEQLATAADARTAITKMFAQALPAAHVELKQYGAYNLEIWIPQREFESITYLDRKALMDSVGSEWYKTAGFLLCSTVTVRDEKSGKNLAIYHCMFSYSDLNPD
jgi:anti-sigma factor RsiW